MRASSRARPVDFSLLQERLVDAARARVRNGELTERGLSRAAGLSQPHVHQALKGAKSLSFAACDRLLEALKLSVTDLTH
jgi:hypothetical protein